MLLSASLWQRAFSFAEKMLASCDDMQHFPSYAYGIPPFPMASSSLASGDTELDSPCTSRACGCHVAKSDFERMARCRLKSVLERAWAGLMAEQLRTKLDELAAATSAQALDLPRLRTAISAVESADLSHSLLCAPGEVPQGCATLSAVLNAGLARAQATAIDCMRNNIARARTQRNAARLEAALKEAADGGMSDADLEADRAALVGLVEQQSAVGVLKAAMKDPKRTCASLGAAVEEVERFDGLRSSAELDAARAEISKLAKREVAEHALLAAAEREDATGLSAAIREAEQLGIRTKPAKKCLLVLQALDAADLKRLEQLVQDGLGDELMPAALRDRAVGATKRAAGQKDAAKRVNTVLRGAVHDVAALEAAIANARQLGVAEADLQAAASALLEWQRRDQTQSSINAAVVARDLPALRLAVQTAEQAGVDVKAGLKAIKMLQKEAELLALVNAPQREYAAIKHALADAAAAGVEAEILSTARRAMQDLSHAHETAALAKRIDDAVRAEDEAELADALERAPESAELEAVVQAAHKSLERIRQKKQLARHLQQLIDEDSLDIIQLEHVREEAEAAGCGHQLLNQAQDEMAKRMERMALQQELRDAMWVKDLERLREAADAAQRAGVDTKNAVALIEALQIEQGLKDAIAHGNNECDTDVAALQELIRKATRLPHVSREVVAGARALLERLQRAAKESNPQGSSSWPPPEQAGEQDPAPIEPARPPSKSQPADFPSRARF